MSTNASSSTSAQELADLFSMFALTFFKWQYAGILVEGMT